MAGGTDNVVPIRQDTVSSPERIAVRAKSTAKQDGKLNHRDRLREKWVSGGPTAFADYELLEFLLCGAIARGDVKPHAKALMNRFGSLSAVLAAPVEDLVDVKGIAEKTAVYLKVTHELTLRTLRQDIEKEDMKLSSWSKVQDYVRLTLQHEPTEAFHVLFLNNKNTLIADERLGQGTVNHAPVYPREIARRAVALSAVSVILVHNHPSGNSTPSRADISTTREIIDALDALEITVHDHLVVGRKGITSFKAAGLI